MKLKKINNRGFSLMEMLVVLFIISLLLLLIIPNLSEQRKNAQDTGDDAFEATLQTQVDLYLMENPNVAAVTVGNLNLSKGQRERLANYNLNIDSNHIVSLTPTTGSE